MEVLLLAMELVGLGFVRTSFVATFDFVLSIMV